MSLTKLVNGERVPLTAEEITERIADEAAQEASSAEELAIQAIRKEWPNVQSFMAEFSPDEIESIANSVIPEVITARFLLSTWLGPVISTDPRIFGGLNLLAGVGIITEERREKIISK